ncbi:hypothetical protein V6Z11_A05G257500 [Gossypium hirsutum]
MDYGAVFVAMLRSTMVSTVRPCPNPNNTPHSRPVPVVALPSNIDIFLISLRTNITVGLRMFPYSLSTCQLALSFSLFNPSFSSIPSRIAAPPGWTT